MNNHLDRKLYKNRVVVVLLLGDDNMSRTIDAAIDDEFLQRHHPTCHLIKLEYGSADAEQFRKIYPVGRSPICLVIQQYGLPLKTNDFSDLNQFSSDVIRPFLSAQIFEALGEGSDAAARIDEPGPSLDVELEQLLERFEQRRQLRSNQVANENANIQPRRTTTIIIRSPGIQQHTQRFFINDTLNEVYNYVDENITGNSRYTLSTAYPRRIFTNEERHMTFLQLNLHHNGIVYVIMNHDYWNNNVLIVATQIVFSMWRATIYPFIRIFRMIGDFFSNAMPSQPNNMRRQQRSLRLRSNVHTLREDYSTDDENNTYNGNSTQQQ